MTKDKPEVVLHLEGNPLLHSQMRVIENSSLVLFCNATAYPEVASYEWYFGNQLIKGTFIQNGHSMKKF